MFKVKKSISHKNPIPKGLDDLAALKPKPPQLPSKNAKNVAEKDK